VDDQKGTAGIVAIVKLAGPRYFDSIFFYEAQQIGHRRSGDSTNTALRHFAVREKKDERTNGLLGDVVARQHMN
jgi:hypothetical protein